MPDVTPLHAAREQTEELWTADLQGDCAFRRSGALSFASIGEAQELKNINFMSSNDASCSVYPQFDAGLRLLEEEGYKLNLLSSDTSVPYVAFLQNGDADIAMLDAGQILQAVVRGQPVKVVYEAYQFAPEGIVVLADSPVKVLADLKGKTIGLAEQPRRDHHPDRARFGRPDAETTM